MKFLYCRECGNIKPRGWMLWMKRCEICGNEMVIINVKGSFVTPFYYASLAATVVAIALYLLDYALPFGNTLLIVLVILMLVLAFIDYNILYERAKKIAKAKAKDEK